MHQSNSIMITANMLMQFLPAAWAAMYYSRPLVWWNYSTLLKLCSQITGVSNKQAYYTSKYFQQVRNDHIRILTKPHLWMTVPQILILINLGLLPANISKLGGNRILFGYKNKNCFLLTKIDMNKIIWFADLVHQAPPSTDSMANKVFFLNIFLEKQISQSVWTKQHYSRKKEHNTLKVVWHVFKN